MLLPLNQDVWTWPISPQPEWQTNVQRQILFENKSVIVISGNSVCMEGRDTAVLVNWFASWWHG